MLPPDMQRVLATQPTIFFVLGATKIPLLQSFLCGHARVWEDVDQLYTINIGIPIVDILTLYDTNGCGEEYIDFHVQNTNVLRGRTFFNNSYKPLTNNCPFHFSNNCALQNAILLHDHYTSIMKR